MKERGNGGHIAITYTSGIDLDFGSPRGDRIGVRDNVGNDGRGREGDQHQDAFKELHRGCSC